MRSEVQGLKACIHLVLDSYPQRFKLDAKLGSLLQVDTATRADTIQALWTYVKVPD